MTYDNEHIYLQCSSHKIILHDTSYLFPDENMKEKNSILLIYSGLECCEYIDIPIITDQRATN